MKIANISVENEEQAKALKAFAKALKMEFLGFTHVSDNLEKERILNDIEKGYKESLEIEKGSISPKSIDQLLNEL